MNIEFSQIYIDPDASFPFSVEFQSRLSNEVSAAVEPSDLFSRKFGSDFSLIFRISAKRGLLDNETRGPTVFKKVRDVEYVIFLPFDRIDHASNQTRDALRFLFRGVYRVLESIEIDVSGLKNREDSLVEQICSDPDMIDEDW